MLQNYSTTALRCNLLRAEADCSAFTPPKAGAAIGLLIATGLSGYTPQKWLDILIAVNSFWGVALRPERQWICGSLCCAGCWELSPVCPAGWVCTRAQEPWGAVSYYESPPFLHVQIRLLSLPERIPCLTAVTDVSLRPPVGVEVTFRSTGVLVEEVSRRLSLTRRPHSLILASTKHSKHSQM